LGALLKPGDVVAEVINPITGNVHQLNAEVEGVYYARTRDCYAKANDDVANIAGAIAFKTGNLLGA
jgi:predicted deacylase